MSKKIIFVNAAAPYVQSEVPYVTSMAYADAHLYTDNPSDPNTPSNFVDAGLARLQTAHPTLQFKSGNPGSPPPSWP